MHQYYLKTGVDGELLEARVHIGWDELTLLLAPHISPDGFQVDEWKTESTGFDVHFVRSDPTSGQP